MARVRYEICARKEGKDGKTFWNKIGVVFQTDKGFSMKLESVPVGWDGWATLFEPKDKGTRAPVSRPAETRPATDADLNDDPPF